MIEINYNYKAIGLPYIFINGELFYAFGICDKGIDKLLSANKFNSIYEFCKKFKTNFIGKITPDLKIS